MYTIAYNQNLCITLHMKSKFIYNFDTLETLHIQYGYILHKFKKG